MLILNIQIMKFSYVSGSLLNFIIRATWRGNPIGAVNFIEFGSNNFTYWLCKSHFLDKFSSVPIEFFLTCF